MYKNTNQMKEWESEFGEKYTKRNPKSVEEMDELYYDEIGITRTKLNERFLSGLSVDNVLEVGCNIGIQLLILNKIGYNNLYGIEINEDAIDMSKEITKDNDIYVIKGSAFNIPYKDSFFDLVFTSRVLIHISPDDINPVLDEIYRCTKRYIWGYEYYSDKYEMINYRGTNNLLWKTDFPRLFLDRYPDLELIRKRIIKYKNNDNLDIMYLLKKVDGDE